MSHSGAARLKGRVQVSEVGGRDQGSSDHDGTGD